MLKKSKIISLVPRIFLAMLLIAISLQAVSLVFLTCTPKIAQATALEMDLQVPIPTGINTSLSHIKFDASTGQIANYIKVIYNYAIGVVGVLAAVVLMIGGLMWITAGGNNSTIGEATTMITGSLIGLVLTLTSYLLLSQINPALVNLQSSVITSVKAVPKETVVKPNTPTCSWLAFDRSLTNKKVGTIVLDETQTTALIITNDSTCSGTEKPKAGINTLFYCACNYPKDAGKSCFWSAKDCDTEKYDILEYYPNEINNSNYSAISSCGSLGALNDSYNCCCKTAKNSCPSNINIACQSCPDCISASAYSNISCKPQTPASCSVSAAMAQKFKTVSDKLVSAGVSIRITEAWPPTVDHGSAGHQNGNCVDLTADPVALDQATISSVYNALLGSNFSKILFECYSNDGCSCDTYNGISGCGQTETGQNAGGKNHFHVCN